VLNFPDVTSKFGTVVKISIIKVIKKCFAQNSTHLFFSSSLPIIAEHKAKYRFCVATKIFHLSLHHKKKVNKNFKILKNLSQEQVSGKGTLECMNLGWPTVS
jgi:hypothetical protein